MNGQPVVLTTAKSKLPQKTIDFLKNLLARAEAGEIIGVTAILDRSDGYYSIEWSATLSRLQRIGGVFEIMQALTNDCKSE
jgi:hypothetical protein